MEHQLMDNLSLFAESLQELMTVKNIKPIDIHNATKICLPVVYRWLNRTSVPTMKSLTLLSDYFQCSVEYLTGRTEYNDYSVLDQQQPFTARLRSLLNEKSVSIRKLSAETQIAKSTISYYLNGSIEPFLDNLIKIASYFDCSIDYLLGRSDGR